MDEGMPAASQERRTSFLDGESYLFSKIFEKLFTRRSSSVDAGTVPVPTVLPGTDAGAESVPTPASSAQFRRGSISEAVQQEMVDKRPQTKLPSRPEPDPAIYFVP